MAVCIVKLNLGMTFLVNILMLVSTLQPLATNRSCCLGVNRTGCCKEEMSKQNALLTARKPDNIYTSPHDIIEHLDHRCLPRPPHLIISLLFPSPHMTPLPRPCKNPHFPWLDTDDLLSLGLPAPRYKRFYATSPLPKPAQVVSYPQHSLRVCLYRHFSVSVSLQDIRKNTLKQ